MLVLDMTVLNRGYHVLLKKIVGLLLLWYIIVVLNTRSLLFNLTFMFQRGLTVVVQQHLFVGADAFIWRFLFDIHTVLTSLVSLAGLVLQSGWTVSLLSNIWQRWNWAQSLFAVVYVTRKFDD